MKSLLVIGSGSHGRICAETASLLGYSVLGFADDDESKHGRLIGPWKVLGHWLERPADCYFVAIGNNENRKLIFQNLYQNSKKLIALIHPFSFVSPGAHVGEGSVVLAGGVIQFGARIGQNVIINTGAIIDHDAVVGSHCHIGPNATVCSFGCIQDGEILLAGSTRFRGKQTS